MPPHAFWRALATALALAALPLAVRAAATIPEAPDLSGRIVYTRADQLQWDLYSADADGENERRLTNTSDSAQGHTVAGEDQPRWSGDGREIAFTTYDKQSAEASIWRMPFDGGTPTPVVEDDGTGDPAWHPHDEVIAYSGASQSTADQADPDAVPRYDLKLWRPETGATTLLDTPQLDERDPDWSPDGTRIAYSRATSREDVYDPQEWDLFVVDADGGTAERLLDWPGSSERYPRWSPDGTRLAFVSGRAWGQGQLAVLDLETGSTRRLVDGVASPPTWSPDGERIIFYNTVDSEPQVLPGTLDTAPRQRQQLLGLYVITLDADDGLARLRGPAGGANAAPDLFEWGYGPDWTVGTATPTPTASPTPLTTDTPTPTATYTPGPAYLPLTQRTWPEATATATITPTVTVTVTVTATATATTEP